MIIDKRLQVSSAQALTATAASTDVLDLSQDRDIGPGAPIWLVVVPTVALAGTSPTLQVSIETDDNSSFSSAATLVTGKSLTSFPVGSAYVLALPYDNERYLRAKFTLGGTSPTCTVDAFFTNQEPKSWVAASDGLSWS